MSGTVDPADESTHPAGPELLWSESYYLDWFDADGSLGGYVRVGVLPNLGRVWYWACLVGTDRPVVTVVDHDVPLPARRSLEVRHDGLWADLVVEEPLARVTANLEAFAVRLDDPTDIYRDARGERVPFGFELDWETDRVTYRWPEVQDRYEIPCRVHGRVMVGDEEHEIDGWGQRDHSWGERDWWARTWCWSAGRLTDGSRWHTTGAVIPGSDWGVGYWLDGHATAELVEADAVGHAIELGPENLPAAAALSFGGRRVSLSPIAFAPIRVDHPGDGRVTRFPRALCRAETDQGRHGWGWVEWNQPPG